MHLPLSAAIAYELHQTRRLSSPRTEVGTAAAAADRLTVKNANDQHLVVCRLGAAEEAGGGTGILETDTCQLAVDARAVTEGDLSPSHIFEPPSGTAISSDITLPAPIFVGPNGNLTLTSSAAIGGSTMSAQGFLVNAETAQYLRRRFGSLYVAGLFCEGAGAGAEVTARINSSVAALLTSYRVATTAAATEVHNKFSLTVGRHHFIDIDEDVAIKDHFRTYARPNYLQHEMAAGTRLEMKSKPADASKNTFAAIYGIQR